MALNNKIFKRKESNNSFNSRAESAEAGSDFDKIKPKKQEIGPQAVEQLTEEPGREDAVKPKRIPTIGKERFIKPKNYTGPATTSNDPKVFAIKNVLGKGLGSSYSKMTSTEQREFLVEEEKVAAEIKGVLAKDRIKPKKIFELILKWLKMIPFVSRFFAKQEAKIKTDSIIDLEKKK